MEHDELLDPAEAAVHLGLSLKTLYRLVERAPSTGFPVKRLPGSRLLRFRPSELRAWVDTTAGGR